MVNTERDDRFDFYNPDYNILNIVVNTELLVVSLVVLVDYNILNIVVNTELARLISILMLNYNILNIVVNTERKSLN